MKINFTILFHVGPRFVKVFADFNFTPAAFAQPGGRLYDYQIPCGAAPADATAVSSNNRTVAVNLMAYMFLVAIVDLK